MSSMAHVHHHDKTNVGDWWSRPDIYFPLRRKPIVSITSYQPRPEETGIHIVGGGGLGSAFFAPHLKRLAREDRRYKLVAWGVGIDTLMQRGVLDLQTKIDPFGAFFSDFDDVGTRVFAREQKFTWVPCASCMHQDFFRLREIRPVRRLCVYQHKHRPIQSTADPPQPIQDNSGNDIVSKLEFLARHEFVVTNTYHGVYWATLLKRKVICLPFKSGLMSFRHPPTYSTGVVDENVYERAVVHETALDECRLANIKFYQYLTEKYGDI